MSGGHFNGNNYIYYQVGQFADELENEIENNNQKDEWNYSPDYSEETLNYLRSQIQKIREMAEIMKAIDYLYSGDHSESSFIKVLKKIKEDF